MKFSHSELQLIQEVALQHDYSVIDYACIYDGALRVKSIYESEEVTSIETGLGSFFDIVQIDCENRSRLLALDGAIHANTACGCGCGLYECVSPSEYQLLLYFRESDLERCPRFIPAVFKLAQVDVTGQITELETPASCFIELVA